MSSLTQEAITCGKLISQFDSDCTLSWDSSPWIIIPAWSNYFQNDFQISQWVYNDNHKCGQAGDSHNQVQLNPWTLSDDHSIRVSLSQLCLDPVMGHVSQFRRASEQFTKLVLGARAWPSLQNAHSRSFHHARDQRGKQSAHVVLGQP